MEHGLVAPFDGMVAELGAEAGAQVGEGAVLAGGGSIVIPTDPRRSFGAFSGFPIPGDERLDGAIGQLPLERQEI